MCLIVKLSTHQLQTLGIYEVTEVLILGVKFKRYVEWLYNLHKWYCYVFLKYT